MKEVSQLRRGTTYSEGGNLYKVTEYEHRKMGRGKATIRVNVRNLRTGSNTQITYNSGDRVEDVRLEKRVFQYLYDDGTFFVFMDEKTYSQVQVAHHVFGDDRYYLKDNLSVELLSYENETIDYELPITVEMSVVESEMAVAGNTATGATKEVTLETGLTVRTPLFVKEGDVLRVDTRTGEYITRV
ncbi:MAG: elongation factor P [Anaerolineae bacterium]|nr:elongation factor P [Anaerolineae bacterium]MCO5187411.1 elongation factor P [Anaerolineae bacterium]MCO5205399.1 elongation factor P [Anaerolineae bacterium]